ncbi:MAG TPA: chromosome segregation protein SMC [Candidatus Binataceae bacterium]|nr:chromosome segregation protein SMC [Candidatus Binataceae bacterium]
MRLKSLELLGFKSFFDSTSISFATGMTAVVGPNGCGKSNVVDAIRWVLGEQAPTRLRGKSTEDLIYIGNDQNPAAGMAEVSLILEAEETSPLPEPFNQLSEVAVTRRVYRSGDSEYLLNKIPCRLKDITEFFMAAQIHSRGYSLIEQGKIEEIIQAKPHELRAMIEEAAGLALFKGRRELSERKLERVKENLSRLNDVLAEIERQLSYARRQAKKAEQYKIIRAELSELERLSAARRLLEHRAALIRENALGAELAASGEAARAESAGAEDVAAAAQTAAQSARAELAAVEHELQNLNAGAAERARTRDFLSRRLESISEMEPALAQRLGELENHATLARAARAAAAARLARETAAGEATGEHALADLVRKLDAASRELKDFERRAEDLKDELSEIVREAAVIRGRLGDLAGERAELDERLAAHDSAAPALAEGCAAASAMLAEAERELERIRAEVAALESTERDAAEREIESRAALEHLGQRVASMRAALSARTAAEPEAAIAIGVQRLNTVLESMNGDRPSSAPAWLRDVLRAPAEIAPALHAVLGGEFDALVVESPAFALRAIEILKETRAGRLSFVQEPEVAPGSHPVIDAPGVAGRLVDMLEVEPRFRPVAEAMLGHVMVADDLNSALAASNLNGHGTLFVTRDGDLLNPGRMIVGGSPDDTGAAARAANLAARDTLERDLVRSEDEHRELAARFAGHRAARESAAAAVGAARARGAGAERAVADARAAVAHAEQDLALAAQRVVAARGRLGEIAELIVAANARMEALALAEQDARARLGVMRGEITERRTAAERLAVAVAEATAQVEARKSELYALRRELAHALETAGQIESQIGEHRQSLDRARADRIEFEAELRKIAEQGAAARARQTELEAAALRLGEDCAARSIELESARTRMQQAHERLRTLEDEANQCNLRRERARTLAEELERGFREKFELEFDAAAAEIEAALADRDPLADESRLIELRARAERIGEVNLAADSEVKELEERASALGAERTDLESALQDLVQTIAKLNREARRRFAETFEGAAKNFEELFPKLMRGGKGRLELIEATEESEAGVTILVQPAGKKVKEIGLLSGGEKALSAMALVFSLFLLNPSPFCVMDEVDAPLDEFSLARFTDLLAELKDRSQFIVITHNQRTMQRADQIHGVTMDRPGISKIISLKIPQAA